MYLTSGYVYATAAEAEKAFTGEIDRYVYSRYGNPTISMFEERLRLIEGAPAASRRRPAWPRCSPRWVRCSPRATGWSRRAACSARASWCATRSCRAGASRRCSSTATICRSGKRRCRSPPRRCSSRRRPTRCSRWSTSPRCARWRTRRGKSGAGQRVRHPDPAAGLAAGRRRRGVLGHQAHRRPGPRARRRDPRRQAVHRRAGAEADAAHRSGAQPVQRVDAVQRPGDAGRSGEVSARDSAHRIAEFLEKHPP